MLTPVAALAIAYAAGTAQPAADNSFSRDELRSAVAELLADAQTRSSLLATDSTAGYDGKFSLADAAGNYRLNISGFTQTRYTVNVRDRANGEDGRSFQTGGDDISPGFAIRRATLRFDGHVIDPALTYAVRASLDNSVVNGQDVQAVYPTDPSAGVSVTTTQTADARLIFDDVFFRYQFAPTLYVKWGQFKVPFAKEELNSETFSLTADRSVVNAFFTQDRSQGVEVGYEDDAWWLSLAFSDGFRSRNTSFGSSFSRSTDAAFTGRVESVFAGTRDQLKDYTSKIDDGFAANLGAAIHWQTQNDDPSITKNGTNTAARNRQTIGYTIDGQIEGSGLTLYAAFLGGFTRLRNAGTFGAQSSSDLNDFGVVVQGAWRFMENDEVFARWEGLFLDDDRALSDRHNFSFVTAGWNHYFAGHAAKLTIDATMATNHTADLTKAASGWLGSSVFSLNSANSFGLLGTARGPEAAVRVQMQVMF